MLPSHCLRIFTCCMFLYQFIKLAESKTIKIKNGFIKGRKGKTIDKGLDYLTYQGIPYAEAPIGELRFRPPVPKKNWNDVLDATTDGCQCVQGIISVVGSEDCLFINVYVPKSTSNPLTTMVWIHGGGFESGNSSYVNYGPDYLLEKDVIVVTFNYRLGILGFLTTGDLVAPGNVGMKDQVLALKWVRDNIKFFGGSRRLVTIFGQSAGAVAVSYHMQSPKSRGLFRGAIMHSGVSICPWALSRRVPEVTKTIAKILGIDTSSSQQIVDGLKKVDYQALQSLSSLVEIRDFILFDVINGFEFGPVIEPEHNNAFFTRKSHQSLTEGKFANVSSISGFTSLEAVGLLEGQVLFKLYELKYDLISTSVVPLDMNVDKNTSNLAASIIRQHYFGNSSVVMSDDFKFIKYMSDDVFVRPIREYVRLVSKHDPVYFFKFTYEGSGLSGIQNRPIKGVRHGEDLLYIWRQSGTQPPTESDKITRDRMVNMWTDFAKTGEPSKQIWTKTDSNFSYLDIGSELTMKQFPDQKDMEMWDRIYDTYGNPPFDTF